MLAAHEDRHERPRNGPGNEPQITARVVRGIDQGLYSSLAVGERINSPNPAAMGTVGVAAAVTDNL